MLTDDVRYGQRFTDLNELYLSEIRFFLSPKPGLISSLRLYPFLTDSENKTASPFSEVIAYVGYNSIAICLRGCRITFNVIHTP